MQKLAIFGGSFNPVHRGHLRLAEAALQQLQLDLVLWVPIRQPRYKSATDLLDYAQRVNLVQLAIADQPHYVFSAITSDRPDASDASTIFLNLQKNHPQAQWFWLLGLDAFLTLPRWHQRQQLVPACEWLVVNRSISTASPDYPTLRVSHPASPSAWVDHPKFGNHSGNHSGNPLIHSSLPDLSLPDLSFPKPSLPEPLQLQQFEQLCAQTVQRLAAEQLSVRWQAIELPPLNVSASFVRQCCREGRSIRALVPKAVADYLIEHDCYTRQATP